jgi:hypothetical protein
MATHLAFHEVDDVDHWVSSPKREEVFGPSNHHSHVPGPARAPSALGRLSRPPDFAAFQEFTHTQPAAEATKQDEGRPDTRVILAEG